MKNILKYILAISICFCLSVPAFADEPSGSNYQYVNSSGTTSYSNYWSSVTIGLTNIGKWIYDTNGDINTLLSRLGSPSSGTFWTAIESIKNNVVTIEADLDISNITLSEISSRINTTNSSISTSNSHLNSIKGFLSDLHDIFANQTDLTLKNNQDNNVREATSDFFSGSESSTSIGTGTIRSIKGSFGDAQSFFGMGEGIDIFGALTDDSSTGPWQWFTQAVKDDISTVQASRDEVYIDFLTPKNEDLLSRLGGEEDDAR